MYKACGIQTYINQNKLFYIVAMVHTGPFPRLRSQLVLWRHIFSDCVKNKRKLNLFSNHIISNKYYMLQTKLDLELKCSSILDIYLRHCFKIVFEIFHVIGWRPLFQINYILILIDNNSFDARTQLFQPHWFILRVSYQPSENE